MGDGKKITFDDSYRKKYSHYTFDEVAKLAMQQSKLVKEKFLDKTVEELSGTPLGLGGEYSINGKKSIYQFTTNLFSEDSIKIMLDFIKMNEKSQIFQ